MANDLIDVIAALPESELARLREKNHRDLLKARAEVARLEVQEQQFELATAKRARGKPGRPGKLTAESVLEAASNTEPPATAAAITAKLNESELGVSVNAVRNHLNKLVKDGDLEKDEESGAFFLPRTYVPPDFQTSPADDDIPF